MRHPHFPTILPAGLLPSTVSEPEAIPFTPVPRKTARSAYRLLDKANAA